MDAFEPRAIEVAGGIARDEKSLAVHPRHRKIAALGNRLRAGADHLAAFEQRPNRRMHLVALELVMRIERRVLVIETDHETDVDEAVLHAVDEAAAERIAVEWPSERVDDAAGFESIVGKLPQLLHAH